jgi:hypothetical protein
MRKMQKKYTTVRIKVDKVTVADLRYLTDILYGQVPSHASVEIRTDGTGTHLNFEWADKSELDQKSKTVDYTKGKYNEWTPKINTKDHY